MIYVIFQILVGGMKKGCVGVWGVLGRPKQSVPCKNAGRSLNVVLLKYTVIHSHYYCGFGCDICSFSEPRWPHEKKAAWRFGASLENRNNQSRAKNAGRSRYVV